MVRLGGCGAGVVGLCGASALRVGVMAGHGPGGCVFSGVGGAEGPQNLYRLWSVGGYAELEGACAC